MEAVFYKDWSDEINTFFEYFFQIHFTIALKKITQVSQMFLLIIPPIKFLEHFYQIFQ